MTHHIDMLDAQNAIVQASDDINHPQHYTKGPIECIQVAEQLSFNLGCAVKYAWRYNLKGHPAQDLRKAAWYLRREKERLKRLWLPRRMWHWFKLQLLAHELMSNVLHLPPVAVLVVCDCARGDFERCAVYLGGMAAQYDV